MPDVTCAASLSELKLRTARHVFGTTETGGRVPLTLLLTSFLACPFSLGQQGALWFLILLAGTLLARPEPPPPALP